MDTNKELILAGAVALMTAGVQQLNINLWKGVAVIIISVIVFIGRGFYKKYFNEK